MIVWHTWDDAEAPILEQVLDDFRQVHPNVDLTIERKEYEAVLDEFAEASRAGLGPDVLVGVESVFAHLLFERGLVADVRDDAVDWGQFHPATVRAAEDEGGARVGVPISAYVSVLFHNTSQVERPPTTFDELLGASEDGTAVGIPTGFFSSYWGVTGLGGSAVDGDGLADETADSLAAWLTWLLEFQDTPGAVLSADVGALAEGFARGDIDLLIANSLELAAFDEQLGPEQVGIATIPDFPNAQPFSTVELVVVNSASVQTDTAALLADFLGNDAQQRKLARSTSGRAPVNRAVDLDPTLFPRVSVIRAQNEAAVVPTRQQDRLINRLIVVADQVYAQVLEGVLSPAEGAAQIVQDVESES